MGITRTMLGKADEIYNEALENDEKHPCRKAALAGFIEGLVDGAVVMYPVLLIGCYYWRKKATGK